MLLSEANRNEYTGVEDQGFYCMTVSEQFDPMVKTYKQGWANYSNHKKSIITTNLHPITG